MAKKRIAENVHRARNSDMLEAEKVVDREQDHVQSRKDRQTEGMISALQDEFAEDLYVWNNESYSGYGGFVLAAKSETWR